MSKQEEIKQLLIDRAKFTERMESTNSYNLADSSVTRLQSIDERIALLVPALLEQVEQQPELWECPGCGFTYAAEHEDIDPATGEGNGNHTCPLCELIDAERERDKWKELAEAKVVFASNGNDDYQYGLQEDNMRLRKALTDALKLMDKKFYGMAHKNIVEAVGQEGEGNQ